MFRRCVVGLLACVMVMGCSDRRSSLEYPRPGDPVFQQPDGWPAVSARLKDNSPFLFPGPIREDTRLIGYCSDVTKTGERREGNWITSRYVARFDVLHVEKGQRTGKTLVFGYENTWPTPESGILLDKAPVPFRPGTANAVSLANDPPQPTITRFEPRSVLPPFGKYEPPHFKADTYGPLSDAVRARATELGIAKPYLLFIEESARCVVVQRLIWSADGKPILFLVDRQTLKVTEYTPTPLADASR